MSSNPIDCPQTPPSMPTPHACDVKSPPSEACSSYFTSRRVASTCPQCVNKSRPASSPIPFMLSRFSPRIPSLKLRSRCRCPTAQSNTPDFSYSPTSPASSVTTSALSTPIPTTTTTSPTTATIVGAGTHTVQPPLPLTSSSPSPASRCDCAAHQLRSDFSKALHKKWATSTPLLLSSHSLPLTLTSTAATTSPPPPSTTTKTFTKSHLHFTPRKFVNMLSLKIHEDGDDLRYEDPLLAQIKSNPIGNPLNSLNQTPPHSLLLSHEHKRVDSASSSSSFCGSSDFCSSIKSTLPTSSSSLTSPSTTQRSSLNLKHLVSDTDTTSDLELLPSPMSPVTTAAKPVFVFQSQAACVSEDHLHPNAAAEDDAKVNNNGACEDQIEAEADVNTNMDPQPFGLSMYLNHKRNLGSRWSVDTESLLDTESLIDDTESLPDIESLLDL